MDSFRQAARIGRHDHPLSTLRQALSRWRVRSLVSSIRALIHFGPWRHLCRAAVRLSRPPVHMAPRQSERPSLLPQLDTSSAVRQLQQSSYAVVGALHPAPLARLRSITERLPLGEYPLMHLIDDDIADLARDPQVLAVLRAWFRCEPVLLESTLMVTGGQGSLRSGDQTHFHYDFAGWHSLNLFLYLTDVQEGSAVHEVVSGSDRSIGLREICLSVNRTEQRVVRHFGAAIHPIMGPAGTLFFEHTEALHRRRISGERRVMLNLLYASHRGWLSHGRASAEQLRRRARQWAAASDA